MMTIEKFAEQIMGLVKEALPNCEVRIQEVTKNNGTKLTGFIISDKNSNIAPNIYLDDFYKEAVESGKDIAYYAKSVIETYNKHRLNEHFSVDFFTDFEQAKRRLTMKVINHDKNVEMLMSTPHFIYGDLAIIFQVQVDQSEFGNATITVKNEHVKMWNVDPQILYDAARENMEKQQPFRIQNLLEIMAEMMGMAPEEIGDDGPHMYVMSNEAKINGAAAMIFTEKLQAFAEAHETNLFILPSSVHELILIPERADMDAQDFKSMVMQVNETEVSPEEVLSDSVYYYNRHSAELSIATTGEVIKKHAA